MNVDKKRLKLLHELVKHTKFEVVVHHTSGFFNIGDIKWIVKKYPISKDLERDLTYLRTEELIGFETYKKDKNGKHEQDEYGGMIRQDDHLKWVFWIEQKGCDSVKEASRNFFKKMIDKQPATFVQILIGIVAYVFGLLTPFLTKIVKGICYFFLNNSISS